MVARQRQNDLMQQHKGIKTMTRSDHTRRSGDWHKSVKNRIIRRTIVGAHKLKGIVRIS